MKLVRVLGVSLIVLVFVVQFSMPVAAIGYGTLGGRPAYPRSDNTRTQDIFVHVLVPGSQQDEGILVINNTEAEKKLMIYATDSTPSTNGGFACEQLSDTPDKVGSWITFGTPQEAVSIPTNVEEDRDRDGLTDIQETEYGTDPGKRDTDGDGFFDGTEVYFGYNPLGQGALAGDPLLQPDNESEEVSDEEEEEVEVDLSLIDTDEDGLTDQEELDVGTNPTKADTDGDDITDAIELADGSDPLQPVVISLNSNSNILLPFSITLPDTVGVGEHDGCIVIQEKKPAVHSDSGINLATRVGLRVAITVPGDIDRALEIIDLQITDRVQGGKILHPIVKNVGNVSIDADVILLTKNVFGTVIKQHGGKYAIFRGRTSEWNFELAPTFWGGYYKTELTVEYDANPEARTGVESGKKKTLLIFPAVWFFMIPSLRALVIYGAVLILIIVLLLTLLFYRKRKKWMSATWVERVVQSGDTLQSLAAAHDVSWKLLIRANKLQPPYTLHIGSAIKVPPKIS